MSDNFQQGGGSPWGTPPSERSEMAKEVTRSMAVRWSADNRSGITLGSVAPLPPPTSTYFALQPLCLDQFTLGYALSY